MGIRITGIDTPFGGLSWEYTEDTKHNLQALLCFLETKRLLVNPIEMETKSWCAKSAIEIKTKLYDTLQKQNYDEETINCLHEMVDSCNDFLDRLQSVSIEGIIYKNKDGDWVDFTFSQAMSTFRKEFKKNINKLTSAYDLSFVKVIPD